MEFYRPVLDAMREMFGPERLTYASNWPVSERFAPLATVQGIVGEYFRSYGRRAEEKVFWQSARAAYLIPFVRTSSPGMGGRSWVGLSR